MSLTMTEILSIPTLPRAKAAAREATLDAVDYWDLTKYVLVMTVRELVSPGHQMTDAPSKIVRQRIADMIVRKYRQRKMQRLAVQAAEEAEESMLANARKCGLDVDIKDVRHHFRQLFASKSEDI